MNSLSLCPSPLSHSFYYRYYLCQICWGVFDVNELSLYVSGDNCE